MTWMKFGCWMTWVNGTTVTWTCAWCVRDPLVPVTLTVKVPSGVPVPAEIVSWEEPDPPVMLVMLSVAVSPVAPVGTDGVRVTASENPLIEFTVMMEALDDPCETTIEVGFADTLKSWTWTVMLAIADSPLAAPETVQR